MKSTFNIEEALSHCKTLESCVGLFQISGTYSKNHLYDKRSGGFAPAVAEGDKKPVCFSQ